MTIIYVYKMIISSGVFSIFLKTWIFWVHMGGKRAKNSPECEKIMSVGLHISETIHYMIVTYVANV